jgi:glyoxylate reductase
MRMLEERFGVEVNTEDRVLTQDEIIFGVVDKEALLCLLTDTIDKKVIDSGPNLRVISNYAVGYNNIDVRYATSRGIIVTNTPGVLSETTADFTFALLMAAARRIPESDKLMRKNGFKGWAPEFMLGTDVHRKTLGIIGLGRIGELVAKRALSFDMEVIYNDSERKMAIEWELDIKFARLEELLRNSDFVSLHVPLTQLTKCLIGKDELNLMKETAYLINTSRGGVVDEEALIEALRNGRLRGAALDVYTGEPDNINSELYELDNIVLTPHLGSATFETRSRMAELAAQAVIDVLEGRTPTHIVNPRVLAT